MRGIHKGLSHSSGTSHPERVSSSHPDNPEGVEAFIIIAKKQVTT